MEPQFIEACRDGRLAEIQEILTKNPSFNVNYKSQVYYGTSGLDSACQFGHLPVVLLLLAHPGINVNQKTSFGETPFHVACTSGRIDVVRLLLKDPRVLINEPDGSGYTPLREAAAAGMVGVVKWMIVSERDLDLGETMNRKFNAIEIAQDLGNRKVAAMLRSLKKDPEATREKVRLSLRTPSQLAAAVFALVVFCCDDLLQISASQAIEAAPAGSAGATRFIEIAQRLPMELQMILCHRTFGSSKYRVLVKDFEEASKKLARSLPENSLSESKSSQ